MQKTLKQSLYTGLYDAVLENWKDLSQDKTDGASAAVAAYASLGKMLDAEAVYERYAKLMSDEDLSEANFFIAVTHARNLDTIAAKKFLIANWKLSRHSSDAKTKAYARLGLAFTRYSYGRYELAKQHASAAYKFAASCGFIYGQLIAQDLLAHANSCLGFIEEGLQSFFTAKNFAKQLGIGTIEQASELSIHLYRSTCGLDQNSVATLSESLKGFSHKDAYSIAQSKLEIARIAMLMGKMQLAKSTLEDARGMTHELGNWRMKLIYQLRLAELHYLEGKDKNALEIVDTALSLLSESEPNTDLRIKLSFLGMRQKLSPDTSNLDAIRKATLQSKGLIATRVWNRSFDQKINLRILRGQDPLGDLIDDVVLRGHDAMESLLNTPYLGLITKCLGLKRGGIHVIYGSTLTAPIVIEDGEVSRSDEYDLSPMQIRFLNSLGHGPKNFSDLASDVWSERYNPDRHNNIILNFVRRLEIRLGLEKKLFQKCDLQLALAPDTYLRDLSTPIILETRASSNINEPAVNYRQRWIIDQLRELPYIDAKNCSDHLGISQRTAARDLKQLVELGLMSSSGKGKAIRYHRVEV